MFKYFDTQNKGAVTLDEFAKVLEKTGMYYPHKQIHDLFNSYDSDQSGSIDYRELAFRLFNENMRPDARPKQLQAD